MKEAYMVRQVNGIYIVIHFRNKREYNIAKFLDYKEALDYLNKIIPI